MRTNIQWHNFKLTEAEWAKIKNQQPLCLRITGLYGAGKSTLVNAFIENLNSFGKYIYDFIGDNPCHDLNQSASVKKIGLTFDNGH